MARKKRRRFVPVGEAVEDLTIHHYERAWELVQGKASRSQVLRLVPLTGPQLHHLWTQGLPARKGRYPAQPSFELRIAEQMAELRSAAAEAAAEVSIKGVRVLSQTLDNADRANRIAEMLLTYQEHLLTAELAKEPEERAHPKTLTLGEEGIALLRALRPWADVRVPTAAFGRMFGQDLTQIVQSEMLPTGVIDTDAREKLPAAQTMRPEMGAVEGAGDFDDWTDEELEAFADTGVEPTGKT